MSSQDTGLTEYFQIASTEDIKEGERLFVEIDGTPIVIFNVGGSFYAIADTCTHDEGPLGEGDLEEYEIVCPRHGARFNIRNGEALTLPAVAPTACYPIRVTRNIIEIGFPKKPG